MKFVFSFDVEVSPLGSGLQTTSNIPCSLKDVEFETLTCSLAQPNDGTSTITVSGFTELDEGVKIINFW